MDGSCQKSLIGHEIPNRGKNSPMIQRTISLLSKPGGEIIRKRLIWTAIVLLSLAWGTWNCKDSVTGPSPIVFPAQNVSFGKYVLPLFLQECAIPECHTEESSAGNLALESWTDVMSAPLVVIPRDTVNSVLVWSIEQKNGKSRMPPINTSYALTPNQINGLKQWIYEGAKDN